MTYLHLAYLHLATVIPAFLIGTYLLLNRKGTALHKNLGKAYMLLMLLTASIALTMPAQIGPTLFDHFGLIHIFCLVVFTFVTRAYLAVRRGNIRHHRLSMLGVYFGGIITAGAFALSPGRLLHSWIFS